MKRVAVVLLALFICGCGSGPSKEEKQAAGGFLKRDYFGEGVRQLKQGNPLAAIKSLNLAIRQSPLESKSYLLLGETYMRLKQYDRAADTFLAASRVAPNEGEIYYLLAVNYGLSGDLNLAQLNARKSVLLFQQEKDEKNFKKSLALLQGLMKAQPDIAVLTTKTK